MKLVLLIVVVSLSDRSASAEEAGEQEHPVAPAAEQVKKLAAQLARAAGGDLTEPWLVLEALLLQGEIDVARSFAGAAPEADAPAMLAYVQRASSLPDRKKAWEEGGRAKRRLDAKDLQGALEQTAEPRDAGDTVAMVYRLHQHGVAAMGLRKYKAARTALERAAEIAARLGAFKLDTSVRGRAALAAYHLFDFRGAAAQFRRVADGYAKRGDDVTSAQNLLNAAAALTRLGSHDEASQLQQRAVETFKKAGRRGEHARALNNLGSTLSRRGQYADAEKVLAEAVAIRRELGDKGNLAHSLMVLASTQNLVGHYAAAEKNLVEAIELCRALGANSTLLMALHERSVTQQRTGLTQAALRTLKEMLSVAKEVGTSRAINGILATQASVLQGVGRFREAEQAFRSAIDGYRTAGDRPNLGTALQNLGILKASLGETPQARRLLTRALRIAKETSHTQLEVDTLGHLGNLERHASRYTRALELLERCRALNVKHGNEVGVANALGNMASVLTKIGGFERAARLYEQSIAIHQKQGGKADEAVMLDNLGTTYMQLGQFEQASKMLEQAFEIMTAIEDREGLIRVTGHRGALLLKQGKSDEALDFLRRARADADEYAHPGFMISTRTNLAMGLLEAGQLDEAAKLQTWVLQQARERAVPSDLAAALSGMASVRLAQGEARVALELATEVLDLLPLLVGGLGAQQSAQARARWQTVFERGAQAAAALADHTKLWHFLESGRAMQVVASLGGRATLDQLPLDAEVRAALTEARREEAEALRRYEDETKRADKAALANRKAELDRARQALVAAYQRAQRVARAGSSAAYPEPVGLDSMRASLDEDTVLVEYARLDGRLHALVVTKQGTHWQRLGRSSEAETLVARLEGADHDRWTATIDELERQLVDPLQLDEKFTRVLVAPVGALASMPLPLMFGSRGVVLVPSGTAHYLVRSHREQGGQGVLALGDPVVSTRTDAGASGDWVRGPRTQPLPASRKEAEAIGSKILLGNEATESSLRKMLQSSTRWRSVHIACHGLIDMDHPLLSALALTPDAENDGFLTMYEVLEMRIKADLAVLSACETGRGRNYAGEGLLGFTRAFMIAGVPSVLVSLWKVDDAATSAFMQAFYAAWHPQTGTGVSASAALRRAREHVRAQNKWSHPRYWAAWVLWGRDI